MSEPLPTLPEATRARLRERIERAIPQLHGWTSVDKGARMAELVIAAGSRRSVELGVFGGRGTISLAIGHEARGEGEVLAVDPWERAASLEGENAPENDDWWGRLDHDEIPDFRAGARRHGAGRWCCVLRRTFGGSRCTVADGSVDVLHQDSNHSEAISTAEVEQWTPKIAPGGFGSLTPTGRRRSVCRRGSPSWGSTSSRTA
jgi:hypothetical protein